MGKPDFRIGTGGRHPYRQPSGGQLSRIAPRIASEQVITNVHPAQAQVLNRANMGTMIEGGQTKFFPFSLCGVPVPAVATSVDVHVQFDAGPAGAFPAIFRFNLNAGQPTGPC